MNVLSRALSHAQLRAHFGNARVETTVFGFKRHDARTGRVRDVGEVHMPPRVMETQALWVDVPVATAEAVAAAGGDYAGGVHAAGHAVIALLPLFLLCDRADVGTECPSPSRQLVRPSHIVMYDAQAGGVGVCRQAFQFVEPLLRSALEVMQSCPCVNGCVACVLDPVCSEHNYVTDKRAGVLLLRGILEGTTPAGSQ